MQRLGEESGERSFMAGLLHISFLRRPDTLTFSWNGLSLAGNAVFRKGGPKYYAGDEQL